MEEDPRIGEVADGHAEARQDGDRAEDLHNDHEGHEVCGVAEVGECLPDPLSLGDVHERRSQVESGQQRRAGPVDVDLKHSGSCRMLMTNIRRLFPIIVMHSASCCAG